MAQSFINREGEVAREFLDSILSAEDSASHLFDTPAPSPQLQSFSNHVRKLPGMIRAVIYSPDFYIRFSTDAEMIGREFADNDELKEAFEGRIIASMEEVEESTKSEHVAFNLPEGEDIIEAYIPVRDAAGKVVAVVEFYSLPDTLKDIISRVTLTIWASAVLCGPAAVRSALRRGGARLAHHRSARSANWRTWRHLQHWARWRARSPTACAIRWPASAPAPSF